MARVLPAAEPHPHARAVLGAALAPGGRASHAYLLHGPAGTGKRRAAREFAAELLAMDAADPAETRRRAIDGVHPDLTWVAPTGAHEMRVEDIADPVVKAAVRTPFEAHRRVFVIERADTLHENAANRLLKTLEEPPSYVHLVLVTDHLSEVLPTIRSRCQLVRFDPLPEADVAARVQREAGVDEPVARACARLARGDAELAVHLAAGEGAALRAEAERYARAVVAGHASARPWRAVLERAAAEDRRAGEAVEAALAAELEFAAKSERKRVEREYQTRIKRVGRRARTRAIDLSLELAAAWLRDLACLASGAGEAAWNADRGAELSAEAEGRDPAVLFRAVELVEEARLGLKRNVGEELLLESLAYRLEALVAGEPLGAAAG
jgi:DNA polymerase-3 subunit delta'